MFQFEKNFIAWIKNIMMDDGTINDRKLLILVGKVAAHYGISQTEAMDRIEITYSLMDC